MKTPHLFATFAAAGSAAASTLIDPAQVMADWDRPVGGSGQLSLDPDSLALTAPSPGHPTVGYFAPSPVNRPKRNGDVIEIPSDRLFDSKIIHGKPGELPPPGAKSWTYRGQQFWIIPITSAATPVSDAAK
ncbi:MAG TPA: hypothetical protein VG734_16115 [Lacunisphaera sp.]|nr:hypothetical protein [Lacunisphaera sp.]